MQLVRNVRTNAQRAWEYTGETCEAACYAFLEFPMGSLSLLAFSP